MVREWLKKELKLSDEEIRAYAWILKETDGGEKPLQTTTQEFQQATRQTKTFAGELLEALVEKGCIEYQRVKMLGGECLLFIRVVESAKPSHELCGASPLPEVSMLAPSSSHIDYRDVAADEEDEREVLLREIEGLSNEKNIVIEPWMLKLRLKPLALLYYAYAYSNRTNENRWYEKLADTCEKLGAKETSLSYARSALAERGLLVREIPQRQASPAYPYIVKTTEIMSFKKTEEN